jgi:RNA polymerase sigma-70 factor (ECF subfamily)
MTGELSSWALVEAAKAGDMGAYGQLWRRYHDVIYSFVMARRRGHQWAEETTSETFTRALRRIDSVSDQGQDVAAWLVTIARNILLDEVKSARYRLEVPCSEFTDADRGFVEVESAVLARDRAATFRRWVALLKDDQRRVIELRFYEGLSVEESAAALGRSTGALKALQHRAVQRLAGFVDPVLV